MIKGQGVGSAVEEKGMIHILVGWSRGNGMGFHHAIHKSVQLESYDLFASGIFHLMF